MVAQIDWSNLTIKRSFAVSQKETSYDFSNPLFDIIEEIYLDSRSQVKDIINSREKAEILKILRKAKIKSIGFLTDGGREITVEVPIVGAILDLLTPHDIGIGQPVVQRYCPFCGQPWPKGRPVPSGISLLIKDEIKETFTGIVFDCSRMDLRPALFPRIINESGQLVYGLPFAARNYIIDSGLAAYLSGDDQLLVSDRIGNHPLRIKPLKVVGSDIIISDRDGRRVHGSEGNLDLLRQCRVVIISE